VIVDVDPQRDDEPDPADARGASRADEGDPRRRTVRTSRADGGAAVSLTCSRMPARRALGRRHEEAMRLVGSSPALFVHPRHRSSSRPHGRRGVGLNEDDGGGLPSRKRIAAPKRPGRRQRTTTTIAAPGFQTTVERRLCERGDQQLRRGRECLEHDRGEVRGQAMNDVVCTGLES